MLEERNWGGKGGNTGPNHNLNFPLPDFIFCN